MKTRPKKRIKYEDDLSEDLSDNDYDPLEDEDEYEYEKDKDNIKNLKNSNIIAYGNLVKTKSEIIKKEPNVIDILQEPLLIDDRSNLFQLYEIYKMTEPSTEYWLELRNKINHLFDQYKKNYAQHSKYSKKEHNEMKKQIKILDNYNINNDLKHNILQLNTNVNNKQIIYDKYKELKNMSHTDDNYSKLKQWLNWAVSLPYDNLKKFPFSGNQLTKCLKNISNNLDKKLYGMKSVKEQILLFVSAKLHNPHMKKCSLGLLGLPGTGKIEISRLLAQVLEFPFEQISCGRISKSEILTGHEYTYIGSQPGEIVRCLKRMKYKNGILFLDEYHKICNNEEVNSSLLEITDHTQNDSFKDNFLIELELDLSHLWFIYSMNYLPSDPALRDRIYTINVPGYTITDKICIVIDYLFPKSLQNNNLSTNSIIVSKQIAEYLIKTDPDWINDMGVRTVDKIVNKIVTKLDFLVKHQDKKGNISDFNMSFNMHKFISYPVILTEKMIDIFL